MDRGLVLAIGLTLGGMPGFASKSARDVALRLAYTFLPIAGRGDADWRYGWIPIVGPVLGALLGIGVWRLL